MFAGWINRHQQAVIVYQREEVRVLREMLGDKRLRFTDEQRRRLALKAEALSRCTLKKLGPLVTPNTLCRWFRKYAGAKYDSSGVLRRAGAKPVRLPRRSPNLNAFIERFIRSIKEDCLDRVIPLGEAHLRELIGEYIAHYHVERPHQGLGGAFVQPSIDHAADGPLLKRGRLGGLLNYYYREARDVQKLKRPGIP